MNRHRVTPTGVIIAAFVGAVGLALSPGLFAMMGWSGPDAAARFDPLLSLCLASRPAVVPQALWKSWSLAPQIVLPLTLAATLYGLGVSRQRRNNGSRQPDSREIACFVAGVALLAVVLVSPLCRLAATTASFHMIQHVLIMAVIPPLIVLGRPLATMHAGIPGQRDSGLARTMSDAPAALGWLRNPPISSALYAIAIWLSHVPRVYEAALLDPAMHLLLLAFQLMAAFMFWSILIQAAMSPKASPAATGAGLLMAALTFMHTGLLGALLTFASQPWYPIFSLAPEAWGLSPLEDQQLAGVIMWLPMGAIYLIAGLVVMARLLTTERPEHGVSRTG